MAIRIKDLFYVLMTFKLLTQATAIKGAAATVVPLICSGTVKMYVRPFQIVSSYSSNAIK